MKYLGEQFSLFGKTFLIICLITGVIEACNTQNYISKETINWMSEISDISIPEKAEQINCFPYNEWGKLVKYRLTEKDIDKFITRYGLSPIESMTDKMDIIVDVEKEWKNRTKNLSSEGEYFYLSNCKQGVTWHVLIDKTSRFLWFEVLYADFSGDIPDCDNDSSTTTKPH